MDIIIEAEKLQKALAEIEQRRSTSSDRNEAENLERLRSFFHLALDEIWTDLLLDLGEPAPSKRSMFSRR
jgi:hypothetical protein